MVTVRARVKADTEEHVDTKVLGLRSVNMGFIEGRVVE